MRKLHPNHGSEETFTLCTYTYFTLGRHKAKTEASILGLRLRLLQQLLFDNQFRWMMEHIADLVFSLAIS